MMRFYNSSIATFGRAGSTTALVKRAADQIAATARATAPVDTGAYKAAIHVEARRGLFRDYAVVVADDPASMLVEAKTGNLVRALRSNGV
jgi:ABC-type sugar transport system ATPase subunit